MITLEWKELVRDPGTAVALVFFALVLAIALGQGRSAYERQREAINAAVMEAHARLQSSHALAAELNADPQRQLPYWRDPRDISGFANNQLITYAVKPPQPLVALNIGQSDLYPAYVRLNTGSIDKGAGAHEIYNPHALAAGGFDVAFVSIFLLPLLLIATSAAVASREREVRVHALIALAAGSPWRAYLRRVAMRAAVLWLVLALAVVIARMLGIVPRSDWAELVQFLALVALYLGFWTAVIAAVAFRSSMVGQAALSLFGVWILLLIVIPAIANFTAERLSPVPSRASFIQAMRDATDEINRERLRVLEDYFVDHPQYAPAESDLAQLPWAVSRVVTTQELEKRVRAVEAGYQSALDRQQALLAGFAVLSPGLWLQEAFNRLSGTDMLRQRDFMQQVRAYHEALRGFFNPRILSLASRATYRACVDCAGEPKTTEHLHFPQYEYRPFQARIFGTPADVAAFVVLIVATLALLGMSRRGAST